jgi:hypothetical protein
MELEDTGFNKIAPASRLGMGASGLGYLYIFRFKSYTAVTQALVLLCARLLLWVEQQ